jgi:L-lactate dehydrogenase (cytochrome)
MPIASRLDNVAEARRLARRVLPRALFDYIDGGAEDEVTMGENERALRQIAFRPRMGTKVQRPRLDTTVLGRPVSLPVLLAPCGLVEMVHPDGAIGVARAARRAGTVSVLSTVAGTPPAALSHEPGPRWFQLYAAGRDEADDLMGQASSAGFEGLVVTIDTPALGLRDRDVRNGVGGPIRLGARSALRLGPQIVARPGWSLRMLRRMQWTAGGTQRLAAGAASVGFPTVAMLASPFGWDDIARIRRRWSGSLVIKGVLSGDDALRAADAGADAVVVSNHGGRQLEGAPATARVLPEVVDVAGDRVEVLMDGGVRRGGDVVKALAIGARAVLVGRPYLYALAVAGEPGVERLLGIFRSEMSRTLSLLGCPDVAELNRSWLQPNA